MASRTRRMVAVFAVLTVFAVGVPFTGNAAGWWWSQPSAAKDPVVIVAGTFSPAFANEPLAARLRNDGYQVFIFELPGLGLGDIAQTSAALDAYVSQVRAQTGAAQVDLIGHSQGGLVGRYYIKELGGHQEVDAMISLGSPHYGTYVANLVTFLGLGTCLGIIACEQMSIGSSFLNDLNAGPDVIGDVQYTNIYTIYDELVRPVTNATLQDGATNVRIQSQCWFRYVNHVGLILDGTTYSGVKQALEGKPIRLSCWAL